MASRGNNFTGRVFRYRWADCGWVATIFEFPQCAEVWISTDCEPRDQMIFAFAIPAAEAEAIDENFVVVHPAARQAMVDLAYEHQLDIDEFADAINSLHEIDEPTDPLRYEDCENAQAQRAEKVRSFNLGPIGVKVASARHPAA